MSCSRRISGKFAALLALLVIAAPAGAGGFVLGAGVDSDSASGRAFSAFADIELAERTWISTTLSAYQTDGLTGSRDTEYYAASFDHWFKPVGIRFGASYWGNDEILDSIDYSASVYYRDESFMLSADYERREFDFVVFADFDTLRRTAEFSANGLGLTSRFSLADNVNLHLGGIAYEYSRDIRLQPDIDVLRFLSFSRLSMINSLIDHRVTAGIEFRKGLRSIDVTAGRWQTAVDGGTVQSISIGYLAPVSDRTDGEIRFSYDDSENFGDTLAISVYLYYFGGN